VRPTHLETSVDRQAFCGRPDVLAVDICKVNEQLVLLLDRQATDMAVLEKKGGGEEEGESVVRSAPKREGKGSVGIRNGFIHCGERNRGGMI
jgi:hypothetical protein